MAEESAEESAIEKGERLEAVLVMTTEELKAMAWGLRKAVGWVDLWVKY